MKIIKPFNFSKKALVLVGLFTVFVSFSTKELKSENNIALPFITSVDRVVEEQMIKQDLVGVAVGIVQNGKITHLKGYGYSNKEEKVLLTTKTPMRWASISKTLTAIAAFQLIEEEKLDFDGNIHNYVPYWSRHGNIKIEHLLSHRSGIQHYGKGRDNDGDKKPDKTYLYAKKDYRDTTAIWNPKQSIDVFDSAALDFAPGTNFLYTSFGFNLLGAAIHEASPKGYQDWVEKKVKTPLGLVSLEASNKNWYGYSKNCKGKNERIHDDSKMWVLPSGGWMSNIEDATKFMKGLINEELLTNTSALYSGLSGNGGYDYGMISKSLCNVRWRGHGGSHKNLKNIMYYNPLTKDGIIILSNTNHTSRNKLFENIVKAIGLACSPDIEAVNGKCSKSDCSDLKTAAVWRKNTKDAIIRHNFTKDAFYKEWQKLTAIGYHCVDFETYMDNNKRKWSGIFKKGATKSAMWRTFSTESFNAKWKEMSNKGYRLIDIETYLINGKRRWDGLFINGTGKYAMYRNLKFSEFKNKKDELSNSGYKLIDVEIYTVNNKTKWSGVWIKGVTGKFDKALSQDAFGTIHEKMKSEGYKLSDMEVYKVNGKKYWAGIWDKNNNDQKINRNYSYCDLLKKNHNWDKDGYEMIDLEIYH